MSNSGGGIEALVNGLHQSGQLPMFVAGKFHCNRKGTGKRRVFVTLYHVRNAGFITFYEYRAVKKGGKLFKQFGISHRALALRPGLLRVFGGCSLTITNPL